MIAPIRYYRGIGAGADGGVDADVWAECDERFYLGVCIDGTNADRACILTRDEFESYQLATMTHGWIWQMLTREQLFPTTL